MDPTSHRPIHVVVSPARQLVPPAGIRVHRGAGFADRVQWNRSPPRIRYEHAVLDVASTLAPAAAIHVLAKAVQSRRTTAKRMVATLEKRPWIQQRAFLDGVLRDVAEGACSVLEHGYLHDVELAHGLPTADRQVRADGRVGRIYRDASYDGLEVELDGRLGHSSTRARERDFDRDLTTLVGGSITARISYGQVFDRPCWTAGQVGRLLVDRGWTGSAHPCGDGCTLPIAS